MKISLVDKNENRLVQNDVICQIRDLINARNLEVGDKLPSERLMAEKFNINRNHLREAIRKLEFYGVLKSMAKSGTLLAIGLTGFNGIIDEIVSLNSPSYKDLVETRISLEIKIVSLAAERRSDDDLVKLREALDRYKAKIINGEDYLEDDLLFHLAIARASKNSTMLTLMLLITPPILADYENDMLCERKEDAIIEIENHEEIYEAIASNNVELAKEKMLSHFHKLIGYIE